MGMADRGPPDGRTAAEQGGMRDDRRGNDVSIAIVRSSWRIASDTVTSGWTASFCM